MSERALVRPTRIQILGLYKRLLRESNKMILPNRREWLLFKIRNEFQECKKTKDDETIIDQFRLGEVHLDSIKVQVEHLNRPFQDQSLQINQQNKPKLTLDQQAELRNSRNPFDESDDEDSVSVQKKERYDLEETSKPVLEYYSNTAPVESIKKE